VNVTKQELWWLIALEATLFFSLPCWEQTATWADPLRAPLAFATSVLGTATFTMLACHVGPAFAAATYAGRSFRWEWILLLLAGAGYAERIVTAGHVGNILADVSRRSWSQPNPPSNKLILPAVALVVILLIAGSLTRWWKTIVALQLALGMGILTWVLSSTWRGLTHFNPYYEGQSDSEIEQYLIQGILLSAAPALVIAWRIGLIASGPKEIWFSGLAGLWLPLVLSVSIYSLANSAGEALYWVPSLPRGFNWALLGPNGQSLGAALRFVVWTLVSQVTVSAIVIRWLSARYEGRSKYLYLLALPCLSLLFLWLANFWNGEAPLSSLALPPYRIWAGGMIIAGILAKPLCVMMDRENRRRW
jgi:hypothetical protein